MLQHSKDDMELLGDWGIMLICCGIGFLLVALSPTVRQGVLQGLEMSAFSLIPSLFPFTVLATFFAQSQIYRSTPKFLGRMVEKGLRLPAGTAGVILLSFIGGYPVGAKMIDTLYSQHQLTKAQANAMLCFCFGSGPAFTITMVGNGVFGSSALGARFFFAHLVSSLLVGFLVSRRLPPIPLSQGKSTHSSRKILPAFLSAVSDTVSLLLSISGFVILFHTGKVLCRELLAQYGLVFPSFASELVSGLWEVTGGCLSLNQGTPWHLPLAAFFLSFGGGCVHAQVWGIVGKMGICYPRFLCARLVCAGLSATLVQLSLRFFPLPLPVSQTLDQPTITVFSVSPLSTFFFFLLLFSFLFQAGKHGKSKLSS